MLCRGEVPIHEPELEKLIADGRRRRRLYFVSDAAAAVNGADIVFIAVGTPTRATAMPICRRSTRQLKAWFRP
jgi:UDPglucose 6-dehydrogenase